MRIDDNSVSGVVAGIFILIICIVGAMGIIMLTNAFNEQYNQAILDPVNSTGIYLNNTTPYQSVDVISRGITNSTPIVILLALLVAIIIIVLTVWAILKND